MFALFVLLASAAQALPPIGNACDPNPCLNGSTCADSGFSYTCTCAPGWTGINCETNINECVSSPCVNGACIDKVNGYQCVCQPGWTNMNCDVDINECLSSPCVHGNCNDMVNGYSCACDSGWTGTNCDVPSGPNCSQAVASPNLLWPPNHKFVPIHILGVTNSGSGAVTISVTSIFQDEPTAGQQDGIGVGTSTPSVRSERDGGGDGRVYHIAFTATKSGGGSCTGTVTVGVPHDQGHNGGPVDGGALYNSTTP
jgi:hypothetical protein